LFLNNNEKINLQEQQTNMFHGCKGRLH